MTRAPAPAYTPPGRIEPAHADEELLERDERRDRYPGGQSSRVGESSLDQSA